LQSVRTVACPRCSKQARFDAQNKWRPFCSERCKLIDMGDWAAEKFRVPDDTPPRDEPSGEGDAD
jgi:endogenous inhibitor of DNA gyrase (YacG/DUF329 family)